DSQYVIAILFLCFGRTPVKAPFEFEPHAMNSLGSESHIMAMDRSLAEELIQKCSPVALEIALAGNVSGDAVLIEIDLQKLPFFEECVHAGDIFGWSRAASGAGRGSRRARFLWQICSGPDCGNRNQ